LKRFRHHIHSFSIVSFLVFVLVAIIFYQLLIGLTAEASEAWIHIKEHLLFDYISNSLLLITFTALFSAVFGFVGAYLVTFYEFPFRKNFSWMLILPLAVPSYIAAYIYGDMFSYTGVVSRFLRSIGIASQIDVMSLFGASLVFAFTLYPYVFMTVKSSLSKQSNELYESAKLLKASKVRVWTRVLLPLTRPALVAGTLLVILETLNDYGVVAYFNVRVFSFAIFDAWFRLGDVLAAIRLSGVMLLIVFGIVAFERFLRRNKVYYTLQGRKHVREELSNKGKILAYIALAIPFLFGFLIPIGYLIYYAFVTFEKTLNIDLLFVTVNTLSISVLATLITLFVALFVVNLDRFAKNKVLKRMIQFITLGYAIPGAVLAVLVTLFFLGVDRQFRWLYEWFHTDKNLVLSSSLVMLAFAYVLRFLTLAFSNIESTYQKIGPSYTEASYTLGHGKLKTLWKVDVPMLKEGLIFAFVIVFIDVVKELPLTLILRPTNYDTMATKAYQYASDEMLHEASLPGLLLVLVSGIMIYFITHRKNRRVK